MLADQVDHVIGIDTHRDAHSVAVCSPSGGVVAETRVAADAFGYKRLLRFAARQAPRRRVWAIEGTGSFGAGLTAFLLEHGEWVVEVDRPARPARRNGSKTDALDAARAAREALAREYLAQPRRRGSREAIRVLLATRDGAVVARTKAISQLKALIINAPEQLRQQLRSLRTSEQIARCTRMRTTLSQSVEQRSTIISLRSTARRALALEAEAAALEAELEQLIRAVAPALLDEPRRGRDQYCSAPGRTTAASAPTPPSPHSPAPHRSPRPPAGSSATDSTAAATANSTARCTRSLSPVSPTTRRRGTTPLGEQPKARHHVRSNAASSDTLPAASSAS